MTKRGGKRGSYEEPVALDMNFSEALERFAQVTSSEVAAEANKAKALKLVEREGDTAPPILFYDTDKGPKLELRFTDGEPWFTQAQMAALFGVSVPTVNEHIKRYIEDGEIDDSVIRKFRITAADKKSYETNHYALDVAFYVGYRVNSRQGSLFRKTATGILVQFAKYGFVVDKERLKDPAHQSIIDEFKETAREIRSSTENVYREVRRIVSMCQDYDPSSDDARDFYAAMENKLLYLATNHTAPEIILARADAAKKDVGLTYYLGKRGPIQKDVIVANNYLEPGEARVKNRATVMLLDYFEEQLDQGRLVTMAEAEQKLIDFIKFNTWPLLRNKGSVKGDDARRHAIEQLKLYNLIGPPDDDQKPLASPSSKIAKK